MTAEILKEQNANKENREIESCVEVQEDYGLFYFYFFKSKVSAETGFGR